MICSCQGQHDLWPYSAFEESVTLAYTDGGTEIQAGTAKDYTAKNNFAFTPKLTRDSDGKELDPDGWTFTCEAVDSSDIVINSSDIDDIGIIFDTGKITGTDLKFREDSFTLKVKAVPEEGTKPDMPEMKYVPCCWNVKLKINPINLTLTYQNTAEHNTIKYRKDKPLPETPDEIKKPDVSPDPGPPENLIFSITDKPEGIVFNASTGAITGTGTEEGTWHSTVTAKNDYYKGTADITITLTAEESRREVTEGSALSDAVNNVYLEGGGTVSVASNITIPSDSELHIPEGVNIELQDSCSLTGSVTPENQRKITALISTNDGIVNFSSMVNNGYNYINGQLDKDTGSYTFNITPIGAEANPYYGNFNGNNHTIKVGLNRSEEYTGIFGYTEGTIENLRTAGTVTGTSFTAGIAGKNFGTIKNCINTASITGKNHVGGIAGSNDKNAFIVNCCNKGQITGSDDTAYAGGIAGNNWGSENGDDTPSIQNCYNSGNINGENYTGGITGGNENGGSVYNCCNYGTIPGTTTGQIAGFSGKDGSYISSFKSCISFCYGRNGKNITGSEDANFSKTENCAEYDTNYKSDGTYIGNKLNEKVTAENGFSQWTPGTDNFPVFYWEIQP